MIHLYSWIVISILLLCHFSSMAQFRLGIQAGSNKANIHQYYNPNFSNGTEEFKTRALLGYHIGLITEAKISQNIGFQSGLLFSVKGFNFDYSDNPPKLKPGDYVKGYTKQEYSYLEIPINFVYKVGGFRSYLGTYISFGLRGKYKREVDSFLNGETDYFFHSYNIIPAYRRLEVGSNKPFGSIGSSFKGIDYGFNMGVGYELNNVLFSLNYGFGMGNLLFDTPLKSRYTHRVFSISASYFFIDSSKSN